MKQEIIDLMQLHLGSGTWACKDFIQDKQMLESYEGIFFWISRENGTSLAKIDFVQIYHQMYDEDAEANRMVWFQDFYLYLMGVMYWAEDSANKLFYYDCNTLTQVDLETAKKIYDGLLGKMYGELKDTYIEEYKTSSKKLPIKLGCSITTLKEALYYAEKLGDTSLRECLYRLRNYRRIAVNQSVEIYKDFDRYSFAFANLANGRCTFSGGVIMHSYRNENRWSIHT